MEWFWWIDACRTATVRSSHATAVRSYAFVMSGCLARMLPGNVDARQTLMKPVMRSELPAAVNACIGAARTQSSAWARRPGGPD
jgi:hypothetical protein